MGGPASAAQRAGACGNGHVDSSTLLPPSQRNVPGVMLTHNSQILKLPKRVRKELKDLGVDVGNRGGIICKGTRLHAPLEAV